MKETRPGRIALFSDFGSDLYQGQMALVLHAMGVGIPVVSLMDDAPSFEPRYSAALLSALASRVPHGTLFLAVVDPGVGGERLPLAIRSGHHWFVGPDNGLFALVLKQSGPSEVRVVEWRPPQLSDSFHGRDLFAPIAARICSGEWHETRSLPADRLVGAEWPADLPELIYIDHFGNAFTGLRASLVDRDSRLLVAGHHVGYARTFCEVPPGTPFWYENSLGLVEVAVNQGRADTLLGLRIGDAVRPVPA